MGSITNRLMWQSSLAAIEGAFTDGLAWAMDYTALRSSEKKVFAHYFGPYPRSWSNEAMSTQAYENYYNNPNYTSDVSTDRGYYRFGSIRGTAGQFDVLGNYR